jgi:hypothetical protein
MAVGPEELLLETSAPVIPLQVLPSGALVYLSRQSGPGLWKLSAEGSTPLVDFSGTNDARLSPNEQWLAYGWGTVVVSGPPFGANRRPIAEGGSTPRWREDGGELFYVSREFTIMSVPVDPRRTPGESPGRTLFRAPDLRLTGISGQIYEAAPDGQRFLLKREVRSSPIHVVINWEARLTTP